MPWDGHLHVECFIFYFYFITAYIIGHLFTAHIIRHSFTAYSITGILDIILYLEFHGNEDIAIWDMGRWSGGRHHSR